MNGTIEFVHPERLWWLLAIPFLLLAVSAKGRRMRATVPRLASVVLRSLLLAIPVLALAGPVRETRAVVPARLDVLLDASRSVAAAAGAQAIERVRVLARDHGVEASVLAFGERPRLVPLDEGDAPGAGSRPTPERDLASDPNPAIAVVELRDPGRPRPALVVFTDGQVARPAAFVRGGRPRALVLPLAAGAGHNARLDEVRATLEAEPPGSVTLVVHGAASGLMPATLRVLVDGNEVRSLPVEVGPGPFELAGPAGQIAPGRHVVAAWLDGGDAEPLDDELGLAVEVPEPVTVMVVAPQGRSLLSSALKVQGIEHDVVEPPDAIQTPALLDRAQVLVLDRMAVDALSTEDVLARISGLLARGGGVFFVPREDPGELVAGPNRGFLDLLPFAGRPLEPKKEQPPTKRPIEEEGLKPPEPEKKQVERRPAPTLGLLLLIDCSSSMKGQTLRLAKEAAIAASEVLHPEDRIGVVAFNDEPLEVLPMMKAGEHETIVDQISRIKADGGTDFGPALDQARAIFKEEDLQIKHCILLSDGHSRLGKILERVERLARDGVTLSTVGVGPGVDVGMLSDMAERGRGKYNPAYTAQSIPQIITVEAERVVTRSGARRPFEIEVKKDEPAELAPPGPEPARDEPPAQELPPEEVPRVATPIRAVWPAVYLKGVHPEATQGIFAWHKVDAAPHAWVALATGTGDPVGLHTYAGFGRLFAMTVPMQGQAAGPLANWTDFANFASQVLRFLTPASRPDRLQLRVEAAGRAARVEVKDLERKPGALDAVRFELRDHRARPVAAAVRRSGPDAFELELPPDSRAAFVDVLATLDGAPGSGRGGFRVGRVPEIERLEPDLDGLTAWAQALGGEVAVGRDAVLVPPPEHAVARSPVSPWWLVLLIPAFLLDLAVKRVFPGSFA